jgi:hypothetical protein
VLLKAGCIVRNVDVSRTATDTVAVHVIHSRLVGIDHTITYKPVYKTRKTQPLSQPAAAKPTTMLDVQGSDLQRILD